LERELELDGVRDTEFKRVHRIAKKKAVEEKAGEEETRQTIIDGHFIPM